MSAMLKFLEARLHEEEDRPLLWRDERVRHVLRTLVLEEIGTGHGWDGNYCYGCHRVPERCHVLRQVASIFSDHPDYDEARGL